MHSSTIQFVRAKLNEPGVSLTEVAEATGISRRSLQILRQSTTDNAWTASVEKLAEHFGYRFLPVPLDATPPSRTPQ
jgi:transcriptional regulator with XRE-family HTH domain